MDRTSRHLRHPGPALEPRVECVAGPGHTFAVTLQAGLTLHDAVTHVMAKHGIASAALSFADVAFDPLVYLVPAVAEGPTLRFQYSDPKRPAGGGQVQIGNATFGRREGDPFVHCHAMWIEADGRLHGGHVVPTDSVLSASVEATAWTLPNAAILSEPDEETGYTLFHPVRTGAAAVAGGGRMAAVRVKPNEDLCRAVEAVCAQERFAAAEIRGGLGSLIGARFEDGTAREDMASEVLIISGRVISDGGGKLRAELDICFSGFSGLGHLGRLLPGDNPVCITFEMLVEESPA